MMARSYPVYSLLFILSFGLWLFWPWSNWFLAGDPYGDILMHGIKDGEYMLLRTPREHITWQVYRSLIVVSLLLIPITFSWVLRLDIGFWKWAPTTSSCCFFMYGNHVVPFIYVISGA